MLSAKLLDMRTVVPLKAGERVQVKAYKSDGTCYRWWYATVEAVETDRIILVTPVGHRVEDPCGGWSSQHAIRSYYWLDRAYSLLEAYTADGQLDEIYINIGSPAQLGDGEISFTDYELDVSRTPPHRACIVDQDEFREAASRFGYPEEFQQACYEVADEALELANRWAARGMPSV